MQQKRQKEIARLTKLDAGCNTLLSLLFLMLVVLFSVFVLDLTGTVNLGKMVNFVSRGAQEVKDNMPFIAAVQEKAPDNTDADNLHIESQNKSDNFFIATQIDYQASDLIDISDNTLVGQGQIQRDPNDLIQPPELDKDPNDIFLQNNIFAETSEKDKNIKMQKPVIDHKKYRFVELKNSLKILLIQDDEAKLSEVSLNVQAGSWNEPSEYPGLAHFCEHMLFEGSKKYPDLGKFDDLVSATGGYTNAYTEATNTNYYFTVGTASLTKTLDVFSHFFIDPLFSNNAVEKEVNAVNSEYEIDTSGDSWKLMNIFTLISDKTHPQSRFSIGNTETLSKESVIQALKTFHEENYSANLMTMAIRTSIDLARLETWLVHHSDFTEIPDKKLKVAKFVNKPLTDNLESIIKYQVDSEAKYITLNYQLPGREKYVETKPVEFIDYFVGSSHVGGLKDYLKKQGFISDLEGEVYLEGKEFSNYMVRFQLPNENSQQFDQRQLAFRLAKITNNYFQYLDSELFAEGEKSKKQAKEFYSEQSELSKVMFKYMPAGDGTVLSDIAFISKSMSKHPVDEVLSAELVMDKFSASTIKMFLNAMMDTSNLVILVGDKAYQYSETVPEVNKPTGESKVGSDPLDLSFVADNHLDIHNELYNLDYSQKKISDQTLQFIQEKDEAVTKHFTLPEMNTFIPDETLALKKTCTHNKQRKFVAEIEMETKQQDGTDPYSQLDQSEPFEVQVQSDNENNDLTTLSFIQKKDPQSHLSWEERFKKFVLGKFSWVKKNSGEQYNTYEECNKKQLEVEKSTNYPQLIEKDQNVWMKLDRSFGVPSVYSAVMFETNNSLSETTDQTLMMLFSQYLADYFSEDLDQAIHAGYSIDFNVGNKGLGIKMYGFSSKIKQLFVKVFNCPCLNPNAKKRLQQQSFLEKPDKDLIKNENSLFKRAKENLYLSLKNSYERKLYEQAMHTYLPNLMQHPSFWPQDQLNALSSLTLSDLTQFKEKFLSQSQTTSIFVGNIVKDETEELVEVLKSFQQGDSGKSKELSSEKSKTLDLHGKNIVYALQSQSSDKTDPNGVTLNYYQVGRRDKNNYAIMQFLQGVMQTRAYNYLRTEKQLGYVVAAGFKPMGCIDGAIILVQGSASLPYDVNEQIEIFLKQFGTDLEGMDMTEFDEIRNGVLATLEQNIKSLQSEGELYWEHIENGDLIFEEKQIAVTQIQALQKQVIINNKNILNRKSLSFIIEFLRVKREGNQAYKFMGNTNCYQLFSQGMQTDILQVKDAGEFNQALSNKGLTEQQYGYEETVIFNNTQLGKLISSVYSCENQVSGF